jgi:hypothetical protein
VRSLRFPCLVIAALLPDTAFAHEAFGNLGPFYTHMLHPAVDPSQGVLLVGMGALLARQPVETVRSAYAVFALACALAAVILTVLPLTAPGVRLTAATAVLLGIMTAIGLQLPRWFVAVLCVGVAIIAALSFDAAPSTKSIQTAAGGALGLALTVLFVWGALDWAGERLHPVAAAVAGSWIAAVGLMVMALPA